MFLSFLIRLVMSAVEWLLRPAAGDLEAGDHVAGYVIEAPLGRGGEAVVYRARQQQLGRQVALKVAAPRTRDRRASQRLQREASVAAAVAGPAVPTVFELGQTDDGQRFFAMELIEGGSLAELVRERGPLPPDQTIEIMTQLAEATGRLHALGYVHRDLTPANVIVDARGQATLIDFGSARQARLDPRTAVTGAGQLRGTPRYLAPEVILGDGSDARTDVYQLGAIAYFMLTGRPPFTGDSLAELCCSQLRDQPVPPSRLRPAPLPPAVDALVVACLAKRPDARPRDGGELAAALTALARDRGSHVRPLAAVA